MLALCERARSAHELGTGLREVLRALVPFDAYCVNVCDARSGVIQSSIGDGLEPEHARALFALEAQGDDLHSLRELFYGPLRIASLALATGGNPSRCRRMREIFEPLGFADELRAALVTRGACYGYLHLFRRRENAAFSRADLATVELQLEPVAKALRELARAPLRASASADTNTELMLLDGRGRVVAGSERAAARLGLPDAIAGSPGLAHAVQDLASRARRGERARVALRGVNDTGVELTAMPLGVNTAIVIEAPRAHHVTALNFEAFALTPREREVAMLILDGRSNHNIALELGVSLYTVKDHVKALFVKTASGSRTELAARLRGDGSP